MVVHVSGMFGAIRNNLGIVMPIADHPINRNGVIVYNLAADPSSLFDLSVNDIRARLFTPAAQRPENEEKIPLKVVHLNKCPVIAPVSVIRKEDAERLEIDLTLCEKHRQMILGNQEVMVKVRDVFLEPPQRRSDDSRSNALFRRIFLPCRQKCHAENYKFKAI